MKLSELTYQVVKNVKYLEDAGFNYEAFVLGEYENDQDYANSINNAFAPINEAIHRLSDRNKIAFACICLGKQTGGILNYKIDDHPVKKIKAVFYMSGNNFVNVGFREMGKGKICILSNLEKEYWLQYIEDIKHFSKSDFLYELDEEEMLTCEHDIELSDYGINEDMCSYIIEYAQGKLQETIAPEIANMHITRAEQYFEDLDEQQTSFLQQQITKKYSI